jgi:hypothetical protein
VADLRPEWQLVMIGRVGLVHMADTLDEVKHQARRRALGGR